MANRNEVHIQKCEERCVQFFLNELNLFLNQNQEAEIFSRLMHRMYISDVELIEVSVDNTRLQFGIREHKDLTDENSAYFPCLAAQKALVEYLKKVLEEAGSEASDGIDLGLLIKDTELSESERNSLGQAPLKIVTLRDLVLKTPKELLQPSL